MKYVKGQDRMQMTILPECIDDLIGQDNPVRVIDAFIDSLNMDKLGFKRAEPNDTGRPSYDPRDLLKLYVYGYFNKIRSSRKLMMECSRNIELFFLLNRLTPDFRTISDFRKDNTKALRNVFCSFVKICLNLNLYKKELLAIDGSKFRAVNSKRNSYNEDTLKSKLERIDENIARYLAQMDEEDTSQQRSSEYSREEIMDAVKIFKDRKEKYMEYLDELNSSGETQILTTDPEARVMQSKDGYHCYYNVQTAVDSGSHLIADYMVTNCCTDQGLLKEVSDNTRDMLEIDTIKIVADKGYESRKDILDCVMNGIIPNVAMKYDRDERLFNINYIPVEITEEERNSAKPEDIQKCISAGVLPVCYENSSIQVEIQERSELSCFLLNDNGTVTCPMGNILSKTKMKGQNTIYVNKDACRQCPNRCTSSTKHKTVSFGPETKCIQVKMYGNINSKLQQIPADMELNSYNHTLDRKDYIQKKVVICIKPNSQYIKDRMCLSEHPFGTVKWYHGAHYLLCKGKDKTTAEIGLSFLAYNLKRAINMVGIRKLIEAM